MTESVVAGILLEFKEGYQIPPYVKDNSLKVILNECDAKLSERKDDIDYEEDLSARALLEARMFYRYNHKESEFENDYRSEILSWQMSGMECAD